MKNIVVYSKSQLLFIDEIKFKRDSLWLLVLDTCLDIVKEQLLIFLQVFLFYLKQNFFSQKNVAR